MNQQILKIKYQQIGTFTHPNTVLKPSNLKKLLFTVYYVCSLRYLDFNGLTDCMNVGILMLSMWKYLSCRKLRNVDYFDLTLGICGLIARGIIPQLQSVLMSLCFFSFKGTLTTILSSVGVIRKIKNIAITMIFLFLITAYYFTFLYHNYTTTQALYGSFRNTSLTLLETFTLDSWGSRGRALESESGLTGIPSILMCSYVFVMTYFYLNILIGLIMESLQQESQQHHQICNTTDEDYTDTLLLGQHYQHIVLIFSSCTVIFNLYNNFRGLNWSVENWMNGLDDYVYTLHFGLLLVMNGSRYRYERSRIERMLLHFIAGPLSLIMNHNISCLCNLLKLATTPIVRGVFSGTIHILPQLYPITMLLVSILMMMSAFSTYNYSEYFGLKGERYYVSFWESFYTYVQILTLDDWCAGILPAFKSDTIIPHIIYPFFILLCNFLFLNILIALSCKHFREIDYDYKLHNTTMITDQNAFQMLNQIADMPIPKVILTTPFTEDEISIKCHGTMNRIIKIEYKGHIILANVV